MRLKEKYQKEVIPAMMEKHRYKSIMAVPRIKKVVVNIGFGRQVAGKTGEEQKKIQQSVLEDLALICGQIAFLTKAKKSISTFKTRQGMPLGAAVTLRGKRMYDFLERLINIALPRSRDFKGIDSKCFDKNGNLSVGIKEHIIFPEISPEKIKTILGLEITVVTSSRNREENINLLKAIGFPIKA